MKISIITVSYNSEKTIERTIKSVISQQYNNIEYIVIDGGSTDNTVKIINKYINHISYFVSEKDEGIYDAINKGILLSSGEIVGILNSDDIFSSNEVISKVAQVFINNSNTDSLIGNIAFTNQSDKIIRVYRSNNWRPNKFNFGFMPPHPSFYCKRVLFEKYGLYRREFKIAADYELLIRFLKINRITFCHLDLIMVYMSLGGVSTKGLKNTIILNKEVKLACELNGLKTTYLKLYSKYFFKIFEFIRWK